MKKISFFIVLMFVSAAMFAQWNNQNVEQKFDHNLPQGHMKFYGYKQSSLMNKYDVGFYFLDISLEKTTTYVSGRVTIVSKVVAATIDTFAVELIDALTVDSVIINGVPQTFTHLNDHIKAPVTVALTQGNTFTARIRYHGDPQVGGNFFSGISNDNSPSWGNQVTWTLSEPFNANQWWPCKQVLTDKADSCWVFITTSNVNKAGSEGILTAIVPVAGNKLRYEWKSSYPIDYYLISAAVAQYVDYTIYAHPAGSTDSVMIQNYVYDNPGTLPNFQTDIDQTADFIELYSDLLGMYPFIKEKYGHCMAPLGGGMEHQTMTTLGYFSFYLTCHELTHMWFGDNVTCATWSDIWLNEGFATYGEYLAANALISYSEAQSHMLDEYNTVMSQPDGSVYIPPAQTNDENRIFDGRLSYAKGGALIHMIRFELQDDSMFFNVLKKYQQKFKDSVAIGLDFKQVLETESGLNFTDFFNEWYFGEGYPTYNISWYQLGGILNFTATQTASTLVTPLFKMLMEYRVNYTGGDTLIRVYQTANVNTFSIPFSKHVTGMVVDPINWVVDGPATVTAAVEDHKSPVYFTLAPNPCRESLAVFFPNDYAAGAKLSIVDMTGRTILLKEVNPKTIINTADLASGVYSISAESKGERFSKKFIKY